MNVNEGDQSAVMEHESIVDHQIDSRREPPRKRALSQFNHTEMGGPSEKLDVHENIVLRNLMRN